MSESTPPDEADLELVEHARAPDLEAERAAARRHHAGYLAIALVAITLSALLSFEPSGDVAVPLGASRWRLPPLCPLRAATGLSCPGCGLTRAFVLIAHGRLAEAAALHRIAIPLFLLALYQLAYRPWMMRRGAVLPPPRLLAIHEWAGRALIAALVVSWLVDVVTGRRV